MKKIVAKQSGMTMWSILFVLAFIAIVVLFVLRALPLYNEKMQVIAAMNAVASQPDAAQLSTSAVRKSFYKKIQVTNISRFNDANLKDHVKVLKASKKGEPKIMQVRFDAKNKLFADLQLLMEFDEKVPLRGPSTGE